MSDFIEVGGKKVDIILKYMDMLKFRTRFAVLIQLDALRRKKGKIYNFDYFMFWCLWQVIVNRKKHFRSLRKMINEVRAEEYQPIVNFVNHRVLGIPEETEEKTEKKNLKLA